MIVLVVALAAWLRGPRSLRKSELKGSINPWYWQCGSYVGNLFTKCSTCSTSGCRLGVVCNVCRLPKALLVGLGLTALVVRGSLVALKDTQFVSQVILHEDPEEGGDINRNDGHVESLIDGTNRMINQPLGAGIGSTGSTRYLATSH